MLQCRYIPTPTCQLNGILPFPIRDPDFGKNEYHIGCVLGFQWYYPQSLVKPHRGSDEHFEQRLVPDLGSEDEDGLGGMKGNVAYPLRVGRQIHRLWGPAGLVLQGDDQPSARPRI